MLSEDGFEVSEVDVSELNDRLVDQLEIRVISSGLQCQGVLRVIFQAYLHGGDMWRRP